MRDLLEIHNLTLRAAQMLFTSNNALPVNSKAHPNIFPSVNGSLSNHRQWPSVEPISYSSFLQRVSL